MFSIVVKVIIKNAQVIFFVHALQFLFAFLSHISHSSNYSDVACLSKVILPFKKMVDDRVFLVPFER